MTSAVEDQVSPSSNTATRDVSLAVLADYAEERWPSMDLVAEMLLSELSANRALGIAAQRVTPAYRHRFDRVARGKWAINADRLINRMIDYPRHARRLVDRFDCFHVCDHSYSQLVLALPAERCGVFCHDLDTFHCLLDPQHDPRPRRFRAMAGRILRGMQRAAVVFVGSNSVRRQIAERQLVDPARIVYAPPGVAPEYRWMKSPVRQEQSPYVLHVGSCIPRKRIDVLLGAFAAIRAEMDVQLIQVGGEWTSAQRAQIDRLQLSGVLDQRRGLSRQELAALYRGAGVVLITSESEGFGLPMAEALACGAPVVASDIEPLREVGGAAAHYAPVGDVEAFASAALHFLRQSFEHQDIQGRIDQSSRFSWSTHARTIADAYARLARGGTPR